MALQSSGLIKLSEIAAEFGGTVPHALSEYYGAAPGIPASGLIKLTDFYGASAAYTGALTSGTQSYNLTDSKGTVIGTRTFRGFNAKALGHGWGGNVIATVDGPFGALSPVALGLGSGSTIIQVGTRADVFTNGTPDVYQAAVVFEPWDEDPAWTALTIPGLSALSKASATLVAGSAVGRVARWNISASQAAAVTSGTVEITA